MFYINLSKFIGAKSIIKIFIKRLIIIYHNCSICFTCILYINIQYLLQNGGSYILAVDAGRESILSVWQWQWGHLLGKVAVCIYICL